MLPLIYSSFLHTSLRSCRGSVVLKKRAERLLNLLGILIGKACFLDELAVDASVDDIKSEFNYVRGYLIYNKHFVFIIP